MFKVNWFLIKFFTDCDMPKNGYNGKVHYSFLNISLHRTSFWPLLIISDPGDKNFPEIE